MNVFSIFLAAVMVASAVAFVPQSSFALKSKFALNSVTTKGSLPKQIEAPDFYWKFRLDRISSKMTETLPFSAASYPEVSGYENLYKAYYLDLVLNGKLEGFDWESEKKINDKEWLQIYDAIAAWSATVDSGSASADILPENDFDLLKQFYPQLDFRELESGFAVEEVGADFPYKNLKEMYAAAAAGSFKIPASYKGSIGNLDASETIKELAVLKEKSMARLDKIYEDALAYASTPFIDEQAKTHYQALRTKLADFPSDKAGWDKQHANMKKEVTEMARLASKKVEHHGHEHEEEEGTSRSEEFKSKYGFSLEEMSERMSRFKADPVGFMENSIVEMYGQNGLRVWKQSQEFSESMSVMSASETKALEDEFSKFLKDA